MTIDDVKERIKDTPISTIVGRYISIKKQGANYLALCPFHQDRNPSLHINDSKNMFMCFACKTGGDAIHFVEKFKQMDFKEAIKEIAGFLGLPLDLESKVRQNPEVAFAVRVLTAAAKVYRKSALAGLKAYDDFIKERGILPETAQKFNLGFATNTNVILHYLEGLPDGERERAIESAKKIGLLKESTKREGELYDTFRNRFMFPITNDIGDVVGFAGRATQAEQKPKYINSQESIAFNKRNILFGAHFARPNIKSLGMAIVVEGQMDAIALHQAGFTNTVAVMGVGISERNIRFLKSLTPNIILALDSDKAGFSAMERLNAGFMSHDVLPRYLDFSPHKDPDDFIRTEGKAAFEQKLSDAIPFIDVQLDRLIPAQPPSALDRKLRVLDQIFQALSPLRGHLLATERLIQSAKKLGLQSDPTQIIKNYNDFLNSQRPPSTQWAAKEEESQPVIPVLEPKSEPAQTEEKPVHKPLTKAERTLIQGFVQHPSCLKEVTELLDFIDSDDIKSFVFTLRDLYFEADESEYENLVRALLVRTGPWPELIEVVTPALFKYVPESLDENAHAKLVRDFRRRLKKERIEERRMELRKRHKDCANEEEARQLMTELQLLEKELMEVKLSQK